MDKDKIYAGLIGVLLGLLIFMAFQQHFMINRCNDIISKYNEECVIIRDNPFPTPAWKEEDCFVEINETIEFIC